jgi:hypothetical protein
MDEKKRVFGFCGGIGESYNPIFQENGYGKNGFQTDKKIECLMKTRAENDPCLWGIF